MAITRVTYAYVEQSGKAPNCKMRTASGDLEKYLEAHVNDVVRRRDDRRSPPSSFGSSDAKTRMERLQNGTDAEFLENAQLLATRLQKEMDGRTTRGFFVALTRNVDGKPEAAVLKLDVENEVAATIGLDESGEPDLEAVKDLLDIPGDLHKGAVYPDPRDDSELTVADKLTETSLYFLRALDVQQVSAAGAATKILLKAVRDVDPDRLLEVSKVLETETRTTPREFFERHKNILEPDKSAEVLSRLDQVKRPVRFIDPTAHSFLGAYRADGLTIRGPMSLLRNVKVTPRPGGWRIQIDVTEKPRLDPE